MADKKLAFSRQKILQSGIALLLLLLLSVSLLFMTHNAGGKSRAKPIATKTPAEISQTMTANSLQTPQALFFEDFSDRGKGWYLSDRTGYTRTFANGELILQCTNQKRLIESLPVNRTYDDFTLTTTFTMQTGDENDSVGLYLRGDSNLDHDYRLDIYGDTTYSLSKESLAEDNLPENIPLIESAHTSALKGLGQPNTVTVTMQASSITLTINDQVVTSITDSDYQKGQIALFVNNGATSVGVTATFSQIEIDSIPPVATPTS